MRVLVAGLKFEDNQFTRALRKQYGVDPMWTDPDSRSFPKNADLVIAVTAQLARSKLQAVREAYEGKPVFIANQGFSEIKEQFDNFLYEKGKAEEASAMRNRPQLEFRPRQFPRKDPFNPAFQALQVETKPAVVIQKPDVVVDESNANLKNPPEVMEKVYAVVSDCVKANMSARDTVEMLAAEGLAKRTGEKYVEADVYNMRVMVRRREAAMLQVPTPVKVPDLPKPPQATTTSGKTDAMKLIGLVLSSSLDQPGKLDLIAKIQAGEIQSEEVTAISMGEKLTLSSFNLLNPTKKIEIALTKEQADLVMKNLGSLNSFLK